MREVTEDGLGQKICNGVWVAEYVLPEVYTAERG